MTDSKNDRTVTHKMNVTFKNEDEHKKFMHGETHSDKGIRYNNGSLGSQPDIEVIDEAERDSESIREFDYQQEYLRTPEKYEEEDGFATEIIKEIIVDLVDVVGETITEILSDEKKREYLVLVASNWWHGKVIFGAKKTWSSIIEKVSTGTEIIQSDFSGKTKAEQLLSESKERAKTTELSAANSTFVEPVEDIDDKSQYRESISREAAQRQFEQIKVLAILLADKIRNLSNAYIRECDMSPEDCLLRKNTIKELTTQEVMNSIKLLLENDSFFLDNSTSRIFSEFLAGNLIIGDRLVPIENYGVYEPLSLRNIAVDEKNDE